jgi:hypothetical protein
MSEALVRRAQLSARRCGCGIEKGITDMTTVSKRNILALLGLAPVGLAATSVQPENFDIGPPWSVSSDSPSPDTSHLRLAKYDKEKMAQTFERLAAEIRSGGVRVGDFHINCQAVSLEVAWLTQTLIIDLEVYHKDEPA